MMAHQWESTAKSLVHLDSGESGANGPVYQILCKCRYDVGTRRQRVNIYTKKGKDFLVVANVVFKLDVTYVPIS